jgi:hypothetical protein
LREEFHFEEEKKKEEEMKGQMWRKGGEELCEKKRKEKEWNRRREREVGMEELSRKPPNQKGNDSTACQLLSATNMGDIDVSVHKHWLVLFCVFFGHKFHHTQ